MLGSLSLWLPFVGSQVTCSANGACIAIEVNARTRPGRVHDRTGAGGRQVIVEWRAVRMGEHRRVVDRSCSSADERIPEAADAERLHVTGSTASVAEDEVVRCDESSAIAQHASDAERVA